MSQQSGTIRYVVPEYLRAHVDRALADAPPLSQAQIDMIAAILTLETTSTVPTERK